MSDRVVRAAVALLVTAAAACSSSPPAAPVATDPDRPGAATRDARATAPAPTETTMQKGPRPTPDIEAAQALSPTADVLAWLAQQAPTTLLRVPVELTVSVMGVSGASLGFAADRPAIKVNDSALGESLADRAAEFCGEAETCALWLWGNWKDGGLRVTKVEGAIAVADRAAATHVFVAK